MWSDIYKMFASEAYCWQNEMKMTCAVKTSLSFLSKLDVSSQMPSSKHLNPMISDSFFPHPKAIFICGASATGMLRVHLKVMFVKLHWMNDQRSNNHWSTCWQYAADI